MSCIYNSIGEIIMATVKITQTDEGLLVERVGNENVNENDNENDNENEGNEG